MDTLNLAIFTCALLVLLIGLQSSRLDRFIVARPLVPMLVGIAMGPQLLGVIEPSRELTFDIAEQGARLSLAVGLMATALQLPRDDVLRRRLTVGLLLLLIMPAMWLASTAVLWALAGLPFGIALIAGAVLTPTDPVLARSITEGEQARRLVPPRLRFTLLQESGFNDGLAYPFVFLAIALHGSLSLVHDWALPHVLWAVLAAAGLGAALGSLGGRLLVRAEHQNLVDSDLYHSFSLALSLLAVTAGYLLAMDGILVVFIAGIAFALTTEAHDREESARIQTMVNVALILPMFFFFGLILPWSEWGDLGWKAPLIPAAVLLLRRLPAMLIASPLLRRGQFLSLRDVAFAGWFGPIGISGLFYAALVFRETGLEDVWTVASLTIFVSVLAFAVTTPSILRRFRVQV